MPTYHRETWVAAPLEEVWDFSVQVDGLEQVTPGFMNLRVESVTGPDGEPGPEELTEGTRIEASVHPFGLGPRQSWVSRITERERDDERAHFRDEMVEGPVPYWEHTHSFYAEGDETLVSDRVAYRLPFGGLGEQLAEFADLGFEPLFQYRHRRTRELLE